MTYEEVKETIKKIQTMCDDELFEELELAVDCIEKQIPKKPEQDDCAENIYYCPTCTRWFNGYHKPHHCVCGQKLDWEVVMNGNLRRSKADHQ